MIDNLVRYINERCKFVHDTIFYELFDCEKDEGLKDTCRIKFKLADKDISETLIKLIKHDNIIEVIDTYQDICTINYLLKVPEDW